MIQDTCFRGYDQWRFNETSASGLLTVYAQPVKGKNVVGFDSGFCVTGLTAAMDNCGSLPPFFGGEFVWQVLMMLFL